MKQGAVVLGFLRPLDEPAQLTPALENGLTTFSMELVPRITRAQAMDALSSMATVAGYKAVLLGADRIPRMFPLLMTAAGTVPPARVLILGAGVAGLQAIATARRLGAVVEAYVERNGVTIMAPTNLPATVPVHASQLYSRNVTAFLNLLIKDGELNIDMEDNIVGPSCVTHGGKWANQRVATAMGAGQCFCVSL